MKFLQRVNTPNGKGSAFGKLPDGKISVAHKWSELTNEFKKSYKGLRSSAVNLDYKREDIHEC